MREAQATFKILSWDEKPAFHKEGAKFTLATVKKKYEGEMEGEGIVEYQMIYTSDDRALIRGMEFFMGKVHGKSGTFFLEHQGVFENGVATSTQTILSETATGQLEGIGGTMDFEAGHEEAYPVILKYSEPVKG